MNKELETIEKDIDELGYKIHSFKRTRVIIKIIGIYLMVFMIGIGQWFYAFILWLLFFPDSEEIIRFFKSKRFIKG